jgi:hypothetical protein
MQLIQFHKVLISVGIGFFLLFGIREIYLARDAMGVVSGVLSLGAVVALVFYLRWIIQRYKSPPNP